MSVLLILIFVNKHPILFTFLFTWSLTEFKFEIIELFVVNKLDVLLIVLLNYFEMCHLI